MHENICMLTTNTWYMHEYSLEMYELRAINHSAVGIRSLNGTFEDTVATVTIQPRNESGVQYNPLHCMDHGSTVYSNCTTRLSAYFSDVGKVLTTPFLQACGLIVWINGAVAYQWAHADLPRPAPAKDMCEWKDELYHEVVRLRISTRLDITGRAGWYILARRSLLHCYDRQCNSRQNTFT